MQRKKLWQDLATCYKLLIPKKKSWTDMRSGHYLKIDLYISLKNATLLDLVQFQMEISYSNVHM